MDRRRGNRKDVKVVDLEFDRAVFVIPFADGAHVVRVAVGRGDGFLDDGAVFADEIGIGVTAVLVSKRVSNTGLLTAKNRKHAWFMVKIVTERSCWLRVAGTLLRSGARAFMHWVLIELGKGFALEAIERSRGSHN
jgi:hypothetical protein